MKKLIARVLGSKLGRDDTKLRGTGAGEDPQKVRLLLIPQGEKRTKLFDKVTQSAAPPPPTSGGCVLEGDLISPSGERFAVLTFHGDVSGWQRQIEEGAAPLGLTTGKIVRDRIDLSDGRTLHIAQCSFQDG